MISSVDELRDEIRALAATEPDPGEITSRLLDRITPAEAMVIAAAALRDYVRRTIARPAHATPNLAETASYSSAGGRRSPSAKVAAIRDWYAAELNRPMDVHGTWKFLRDCTFDDLHAAIASRRTKAAEVEAEAARLQRLADAVKEHDAPTVADLDPAVGRKALRP